MTQTQSLTSHPVLFPVFYVYCLMISSFCSKITQILGIAVENLWGARCKSIYVRFNALECQKVVPTNPHWKFFYFSYQLRMDGSDLLAIEWSLEIIQPRTSQILAASEPPWGLVQTRSMGPGFKVSYSVAPKWGLKICTSINFQMPLLLWEPHLEHTGPKPTWA